jgi:hypothetical protein
MSIVGSGAPATVRQVSGSGQDVWGSVAAGIPGTMTEFCHG